jgi:ArsR family transcriptional regulator, arsenate/arsenite/antimonite-responsive transcriptional repressor
MQDLIRTMKALSDETRLRMMSILLERECCVCEVMQALDISQTRASRNLGILQKAGFLKTRRESTWIVYSVEKDTAKPYINSLAQLLQELSVSSDILKKDKENLKRAKRIGPGCVKKLRRLK